MSADSPPVPTDRQGITAEHATWFATRNHALLTNSAACSPRATC
jgi:hypothetical protein